jgi:hypothetical protein
MVNSRTCSKQRTHDTQGTQLRHCRTGRTSSTTATSRAISRTAQIASSSERMGSMAAPYGGAT